MIERASEFGASGAMPLVPTPSADLSAGQMLRQAREAHGLHIDVVAAALKVPPQKLMALESDNIDALPDPVFARALAASVCRALRIDAAPVLEKLPGAPRAALADADRSMGGSIPRHAFRANSGMTGRPSRSVMAVVGVLLVGALVLFFLPQSATQQIAAAWASLTGGDDSDTTTIQPAENALAVEPSLAPSAPAIALAPVVEPTAPVVAPPPVAPAPVSNDLLAFTARGEAWIRVAGPGGKTVFERTLKDGETGTVSQAELPLNVVVGRASVVDVKLRGEAFDLLPLARSGGVARFEVKP